MSRKGRLVGMGVHAAFEQSRNRVILAVTALQGGLFCSAAVITYFLPQRSTAEWSIFLFLGLVSSVLYIKLINAQKYFDSAKHEYLGALVVWAGAIGFLQRVYFAYHGSLLDDPSIFVFRPVVAFFPIVAIGAIALTRTSSALKIIWGLWAAMTALSMSGLFMHPDISLQRDGVITLFVWDFLAAPVFIFQLYAIPHYEDVLNQSKIELHAAHEKSALTEQLHQSEQRFSMALKGLQVGIWEYRRANGQSSMWWSERFYELVGYLPEEMAATADSFSGLFDDDDRKEFFQAVTREQITTHSQIRLKTKSSGYRWFSIRAYWQRDVEGLPELAAGSISDIHDRVLAESELKKAQLELHQLAYADPLTGIGNRRAFDERMTHELARCHRNKASLCLLLLDLDYFKRFNDRYGHAAGDDCLRAIAARIQGCVRRPTDFVGRIGGEEFGILLAETSKSGALVIAQAIINAISDSQIRHEESPHNFVTVSIGIASTADDPENISNLFVRADRALYEAKDNGRNQYKAA